MQDTTRVTLPVLSAYCDLCDRGEGEFNLLTVGERPHDFRAFAVCRECGEAIAEALRSPAPSVHVRTPRRRNPNSPL